MKMKMDVYMMYVLYVIHSSEEILKRRHNQKVKHERSSDKLEELSFFGKTAALCNVSKFRRSPKL